MKAIWPNNVVEDGKRDFLKDLLNTIKKDGLPTKLIGGTLKLYKHKQELQKIVIVHSTLRMHSVPLGVRRAWYRLLKSGYHAEIKHNMTHCVIVTNAFPGDLGAILNNVKVFNKQIVARYKGETFEIQCRV